ncbi:MAG: hypothetical protein A2Y50_10105 [Pseudomonadales bacterium RIFCSPLOWO2_12_59_9]|uniref:hypothetical protein n=1 Tax=Pseudomonas sp. TaxID=306 RepID=UPI0008D03C96|nr:MAG: hypothetical protein A2Y50_10105 [Pseudomonadales bacterium RIFCSPLOWO2_12_59_9]
MGVLLTFLGVFGLFSHLFKAGCAVLVRAPCWGVTGLAGKTFKGTMLLTNALPFDTDKLYENKHIGAS